MVLIDVSRRYDTDHTGKRSRQVQILAAEFPPNGQAKISFINQPKIALVCTTLVSRHYMLLACVSLYYASSSPSTPSHYITDFAVKVVPVRACLYARYVCGSLWGSRFLRAIIGGDQGIVAFDKVKEGH